MSAKEGDNIPCYKTKTPEDLALWGFLARYGELIRMYWLRILFISIQPLAYIIANYARYDRDKKGDNKFIHTTHLLSGGGSAAGLA